MKKKITQTLTALIAALLLTGQSYAQSDISGSVLYHFKANKPIPSVNLELIDASGNVAGTATTELNGTYIFPNVPFGTYTLHATTQISAGGITMGDALLMFLHLCNLYPFTPIQSLAADVNDDGSVTWDDYWTVVIGWFIQGYPFPAGPWVFEDVVFDHTGAKTNVPTMGGSSSGDVNGTFVPTTRDFIALPEVTYNRQAISNNFSVDIYANDITEASAMGMVINYPVDMIEITNVSCQLGETNMSINNGSIRLSWINQLFSTTSVDPGKPVITIQATLTDRYNGNEILFGINPVSHFCDANGEQIETRYTLPAMTAVENYLGANYPNPFRESTRIDYILPEDGKVSLSLFNQQGQLVRSLIDSYQQAGSHTFTFNTEGLQPGIYYYNLKTNGTNTINETKRMIITR